MAIKLWVHRLKSGIAFSKMAERPSKMINTLADVTQAKIVQARQMVMNDRRITIRETENEVEI